MNPRERVTVRTVLPSHLSDLESLTRFVARVRLDESGPWGFTVRVVPSHPLLTSSADSGSLLGH